MSTPATSSAAAAPASSAIALPAPAASPAPAIPVASGSASGSSTTRPNPEFSAAVSKVSVGNVSMDSWELYIRELVRNPPQEDLQTKLDEMQAEGNKIWEKYKDMVSNQMNLLGFILGGTKQKGFTVPLIKTIIKMYDEGRLTGTKPGPVPQTQQRVEEAPKPAPTTQHSKPVLTGKKTSKRKLSAEFVTSEQDDTDYERNAEREESQEATERRKRKGKGKGKEVEKDKDSEKRKRKRKAKAEEEAEEEMEATEGKGKGKGKEKAKDVDGPATPPAKKKVKREEEDDRVPATPKPTSKKRKAQENAEAGPSGLKKAKSEDVVTAAIEAITKKMKKRAQSVVEVEFPTGYGKPEEWVKGEVSCDPCVKAGKPCKIPTVSKWGASCFECRLGKKKCPFVAGVRGSFNLTTALPVDLLEEMEEAAGTRTVSDGVESGKADVPTNYASLLVGLFTRMEHLMDANACIENEVRQLKAQNQTRLQMQGGTQNYKEQGTSTEDVTGAAQTTSISVGTQVPALELEPTVATAPQESPVGPVDPETPDFHMSQWVNDSSVPPPGATEPPETPMPMPAADPGEEDEDMEKEREDSPLSVLSEDRESNKPPRSLSPSTSDEEDGPSKVPPGPAAGSGRRTTRSQRPAPPRPTSPNLRRSVRNGVSKKAT